MNGSIGHGKNVEMLRARDVHSVRSVFVRENGEE